MDAMECDAEGEQGFRVGADESLNAVEAAREGAEQNGQFEGLEFGGEALEGLLAQYFGFAVAEETHVMAAGMLPFEGDLTAESAGGEIVLAEIGGFGHGLAP
jgi:hypothetical protein